MEKFFTKKDFHNLEKLLEYLFTEQPINPTKISSAEAAVNYLTGAPPSEINKENLLKIKKIMNNGGWSDDQLPDLLKAIALVDDDPNTALGYLYKRSFQGNPIEKKIRGGGGHGMLKDLLIYLRQND